MQATGEEPSLNISEEEIDEGLVSDVASEDEPDPYLVESKEKKEKPLDLGDVAFELKQYIRDYSTFIEVSKQIDKSLQDAYEQAKRSNADVENMLSEDERALLIPIFKAFLISKERVSKVIMLKYNNFIQNHFDFFVSQVVLAIGRLKEDPVKKIYRIHPTIPSLYIKFNFSDQFVAEEDPYAKNQLVRNYQLKPQQETQIRTILNKYESTYSGSFHAVIRGIDSTIRRKIYVLIAIARTTNDFPPILTMPPLEFQIEPSESGNRMEDKIIYKGLTRSYDYQLSNVPSTRGELMSILRLDRKTYDEADRDIQTIISGEA